MRKPTRSDRGAVAIEFALLLPVMLLVIGGIVDWGRYMFTQVTITNAAREGTRAAVVGASAGDITTRTKAGLPSGLAGEATITPGVCTTGADASTTVSVPFQWMLLGPAMSLVGSADALPATASSTSKVRCY